MVRLASTLLLLCLCLWPASPFAALPPPALRAARSRSVRLFESGDPPPPPAAPSPAAPSELQQEVDSKLSSVGWSIPGGDAELTSDDPFVMAVEASVQARTGGGLDGLLNPARLVNLERSLALARLELAKATGILPGGSTPGTLTLGLLRETLTEEIDDPAITTPEVEDIRREIDKLESQVSTEARTVFKGWLRNLFYGQAALTFALSGVMAFNPDLLFGGFGWYTEPK